jgi:hypothetical protein
MIHTLKLLSQSAARFLLISGQATVLYGATEFTEDLDIWAAPDQENLNRLAAALRRLNARVGPLTPCLTEQNARFGHGFHFLVTEPDGQSWPLDVMGQPPRVGDFDSAFSDAAVLLPSLPELKTIDPMRLVTLKKTDRDRDYSVIARLVEVVVDDWLGRGSPTSAEMRWACSEARSVAPIMQLWRIPGFREVFDACDRPCLRVIAGVLRPDEPLDEDRLDRFVAALDEEKRQFQRQSRAYWRPIVDHVKELRRQGKLLPEGQPLETL